MTNPASSDSVLSRIDHLADVLDGVNVEIDFDPGDDRWTVTIDQGIGYTPRRIVERGLLLDRTINAALERAHA